MIRSQYVDIITIDETILLLNIHQPMEETTRSVNGIAVRLPLERWVHITEEHGEMSGYLYDVLECVRNPDVIYEGKKGEYIAAMKVNGKNLIVVYKEVNKRDGFIITSFITRRKKWLEKKKKLWERGR